MSIEISPLDSPSPATLPIEIVERKGVGHPDTICDALAEALSLAHRGAGKRWPLDYAPD